MDERLNYLLLKLYWEGEVSRLDLIGQFNISPSQSTKDFQSLKLKFPGAAIYSLNARRYIQGPKVKKYVNEFTFDKYSATVKFARMITSQHRSVDTKIYQIINRSIVNKTGMTVSYSSLGDPEGLKSRTLYPHSIIRSGFRWHARAFEVESSVFKDFNLSRIKKAEITHPENLLASINNDESWLLILDVLLTPNHSLSDKQRKVIASDYNAEGSMVIHLKVKAAELLYALHQYEVYNLGDSPPKTQQLQIGNINEIQKYLPAAH